MYMYGYVHTWYVYIHVSAQEGQKRQIPMAGDTDMCMPPYNVDAENGT